MIARVRGVVALSTGKRPSQEMLPSQEHLLLEHAQRLARFREGRRAVQIHLSRLQSYNRRDQHIRVAANTFQSMLKSIDGQLFPLSNGDFFFVWKDANVSLVDDAVMRLRALFHDDSLTQGATRDADRFCTWY